MISLGVAIRDMGRSAYGLYYATNRQQKLQNMETLLLGTLKAAAAASVCLSLYTAHSVIKTRSLQYTLAAFTFCVHPLATLDAIGTTCCINGLFHIVTAYIPHRKIAVELNKMDKAAIEQVRAEGYKFYRFQNKKYPPETERRIREVFKDIAAKHDWTQIKGWGVPMKKHWIEGTTLMKHAAMSGVGAIIANRVTASFWLRSQLAHLSEWLAPQLV